MMELKKFAIFICIVVACLATSVMLAPDAWTSRHAMNIEQQEMTVKRLFALSELEKACILILLVSFLGVVPYAVVMERTKHGRQMKPAKQTTVNPLEEAKKKVLESL